MKKLTNELLWNIKKKITIRLNTAKNRPKQSRQKIAVTPDMLLDLYIFQEGKCALTGRFMDYETTDEEFAGKKCNPRVLTIDRIDSNRGYFIDNIQLVCWDVNLFKGKVNQDYFKKICKMVK